MDLHLHLHSTALLPVQPRSSQGLRGREKACFGRRLVLSSPAPVVTHECVITVCVRARVLPPPTPPLLPSSWRASMADAEAGDRGQGEQEVKLLNTWPSMYGLRVVIGLVERGVSYDYQHEDLPHKSALLLRSNPVHKKVPVMLHHHRPLCESLIILRYIDETWPPLPNKPPFLPPNDPYQRAIALFWADYMDKKVLLPGQAIVKSPEGPLQEAAKEEFLESLVVVDAALRDVFTGKPFFGGDHIGLVDIALAPINCWLKAYQVIGGLQLPDKHECPHLHAWMKRIVEYPSVKEAMLLAPPDKVVEYGHKLRKRALDAMKTSAQ